MVTLRRLRNQGNELRLLVQTAISVDPVRGPHRMRRQNPSLDDALRRLYGLRITCAGSIRCRPTHRRISSCRSTAASPSPAAPTAVCATTLPSPARLPRQSIACDDNDLRQAALPGLVGRSGLQIGPWILPRASVTTPPCRQAWRPAPRTSGHTRTAPQSPVATQWKSVCHQTRHSSGSIPAAACSTTTGARLSGEPPHCSCFNSRPNSIAARSDAGAAAQAQMHPPVPRPPSHRTAARTQWRNCPAPPRYRPGRS